MSDTDDDPISSRDATSPHLSQLASHAEQLQATAAELAELLRHQRITADLTGAEFAELRRAIAEARTAGGDILLLATAAHRRAQAQDQRPAGQ